jgi:cytochrome c biogenesis protein CcmG, thiol:disulfide interchange protein DsbE
MRRRRRGLWGLLAGLVVLGLGVTLAAGMRTASGQQSAADGPVTRERSDAAPPLRGRTLTGTPFDLAALHGKVVLVTVWASWCDPCRAELPALAAARQRWSADGLEVVGIDFRDNTESATGLLAGLGVVGLPSVADPQGTAAVAWGARGVPETFVVDRSGRVRLWAQGAVDTAWLERCVPPVLRS